MHSREYSFSTSIFNLHVSCFFYFHFSTSRILLASERTKRTKEEKNAFNAFNTNVNDLNSTLKFPQPNAACLPGLLHESVGSLGGGKETSFPHKYSHTTLARNIVPQVLFESIFSDILIVNFRFHRSNKNEPEEIGRRKIINISVFSFLSLLPFESLFIGVGRE